MGNFPVLISQATLSWNIASCREGPGGEVWHSLVAPPEDSSRGDSVPIGFLEAVASSKSSLLGDNLEVENIGSQNPKPATPTSASSQLLPQGPR
jgi:hypothetical protein